MNVFEYMLHLERIDEFKKSLESMRYSDWIIHKKLGEAAGLTQRYIVPARGGGKSLFYDSFTDEDGDSDEPVTKTKGFQWTGLIEDQDILGWDNPARRSRAEQFAEELRKIYRQNGRDDICEKICISSANQYIQDRIYEEFRKQLEEPMYTSYEWEPIIRPDAYTFNNH